jgi:hypothetical protein
MVQKNKEHNYSEADLVLLLGLERVVEIQTSLMSDWLNVASNISDFDKAAAQRLRIRAQKHISGWLEEDLKMKFLAPLLELAYLIDGNNYETYFEKTISASIDGHFLKTKTDFMISRGFLDKVQKPYFHFQEWKPQKKPTGDSMAQLLEALLIANEINGNKFPIYGCEVVGKQWSFVILEGKQYCISESFDCTKEQDIFKILSVLRKFKEILETKLLKIE